MFKFLKYLPLVAAGKDVAEKYEEEHDAKRPFYLSRRFIGAVVTFAGIAFSIYFGVQLDAAHLAKIADNVQQFVSAAAALYGVALTVLGYFKRQKKEGEKS